MDEKSATEDFLKIFQIVLEKGHGDDDEEQTEGELSASVAALRTVMEESGDVLPLIDLYRLVSDHQYRHRTPCTDDCVGLAGDVRRALTDVRGSLKQATKELCQLLQRPHLHQLIVAHDDVANRRYEPMLPEIPFEVDEDEGMAIKIVRLVKNNDPLGATIKSEDDGSVVVARVMKGGVADSSGCIQVGDRVVEVNGCPVEGRDLKEIVKLLSNTTNGTVTFKLIPAYFNTDVSGREGRIAVGGSPSPINGISSPPSYNTADSNRRCLRALFDYVPSGDRFHPCPEAGLSFQRGDILELVDAADINWWQARVVRSTRIQQPHSFGDGPVGLIPSKELQERKAHHATTQNGSNGNVHTETVRRSRESLKSARKIMYETRKCEEFELDEVKTYEEVVMLHPESGCSRTIVLIGAPGVGRNELKRRMLMLHPDKYATTVPHTSRRPRPGEVDGVDYQFATKEEMEEWVRQGRFLEYGEYKGNIYGTLSDSVRLLLDRRRTPVLNPHPQAIRALRCARLKPFIVFIKPPPFPTLKETRSNMHASSGRDYNRGFCDDELRAMLTTSAQLDAQYGHWFEYRLVNGSLEFAFRELCEVLSKLETESQWVPTQWVG